MLALLAAAAFTSSASAALTQVSGRDPGTGFATWYADGNGLALQLCIDGLPNCLASRAELIDAHAAGGDGEAFYYAAEASIGPITVANELEAAYAADGPDQEAVFMRTQISNQTGGLAANQKYTVKDPYGVLSCTADGNGEMRNNSCRTETPVVALEFNRALGGRIGPFLTWDTYGEATGAPRPGYIGDNATPHRVKGSPTGFNKVRIEGPGIAPTGDETACVPTDPKNGCAETDLFIVQGKVQASASATTTPAALDFGNIASTPPTVTKTVTYTSTGAQPAVVSGVTVDSAAPGDFTLAKENCTTASSLAPDGSLVAGVRSGQSCTIDVTFTPRAGASSTGAVRIADNIGSGTRTISLTGSSTPLMTVDRTSVAFPSTAATRTSAPETIVVGNGGAVALTVPATPTLSGTGAGHFKVSANGCTTPVAPGSGCEIQVVFSPTTSGAKTATLRITDNSGATKDIALTGTGLTAPAPDATRPPAPTGLRTTASGQNTIILSWTAASDATTGNSGISAYKIYRDGSATALTTVDGATLTYSDATLLAGTTHSYTVSAVDGATNESIKSTSASATTAAAPPPADSVKPNAPTGLTATASSQTTISLRWTAATDNAGGSGIGGYNVYRDGGTTPLATVGATTLTYSDATLAAGTTHSYTVSAVDVAKNESAPTTAASATTAATTPPAGGDTTAPTVIGRGPGSGTTAKDPATNIEAGFSEQVQGVSTSTFTVKNATTGAAVTGTVNPHPTTANRYVFDPSATLAADTRYTVTLTGGASAIRDMAGNALVAASGQTTWTFTTGPAPTVTARTPGINGTGFGRTANITATFSEAVATGSVTTTTFTVQPVSSTGVLGTAVTAVVSRNGTTNQWILNPSVTLAANTKHTVTLTAGTSAIRDVAGNPLAASQFGAAANQTWSFTTGAT